MALSGSGMGDEVTDAIVAASPGYAALSPAEQAAVRNYWRVICGAIVAHIQANARLNFAAMEVMIDPGSFNAGGVPVVGQGVNAIVSNKGTIT